MYKCDDIKNDTSIKLMEFVTESIERKIITLSQEIQNTESKTTNDVIAETEIYERKEMERIKRVKSMKYKALRGSPSSPFKEYKVPL